MVASVMPTVMPTALDSETGVRRLVKPGVKLPAFPGVKFPTPRPRFTDPRFERPRRAVQEFCLAPRAFWRTVAWSTRMRNFRSRDLALAAAAGDVAQ